MLPGQLPRGRGGAPPISDLQTEAPGLDSCESCCRPPLASGLRSRGSGLGTIPRCSLRIAPCLAARKRLPFATLVALERHAPPQPSKQQFTRTTAPRARPGRSCALPLGRLDACERFCLSVPCESPPPRPPQTCRRPRLTHNQLCPIACWPRPADTLDAMLRPQGHYSRHTRHHTHPTRRRLSGRSEWTRQQRDDWGGSALKLERRESCERGTRLRSAACTRFHG